MRKNKLAEEPDEKAVNINTDFVTRTREPGEYRDSRLLGLVLRVSSTGAKSYQVQGRIKGAGVVRHTIGKHGAPWTCRSAREEAERILHLMKTGVDPRQEKRERLAVQSARIAEETIKQLREEVTVKLAFESWCADERKVKASTKKLYKEVICKHLVDWLNMPLTEITADMVVKRYDKVADKTVASANNCFRALRRIYNWALLEYEQTTGDLVITSNPVQVLSKRKKWRNLKCRENLVADSDLKILYQALQKLESSHYRDYFTLLLVTGLRKHEATGLRWSDVSFKLHQFSVRDTKNGRDHTLPMTDFVNDLLESRRNEWKKSKERSEFVFPGEGTSGHIVDVRHYQQKIVSASGIQFTPHALRRTFSYAAARVRLGDSERKALLNHLARTDVTDAHYTPWQVNDLREALKLVENYILRHAGVEDGGVGSENVISLKFRKARI